MMMRCILCVLSGMVAMTLVMTVANGQDTQMPVAQPAPAPNFEAPPAIGEPSAPQSAAKPGVRTKVVYKEKSFYDFEDVLINGNLRAPDGSFIFRKNDTNFSSALNLKRSFIPELKESGASAR